jgi:hypothetical protein
VNENSNLSTGSNYNSNIIKFKTGLITFVRPVIFNKRQPVLAERIMGILMVGRQQMISGLL